MKSGCSKIVCFAAVLLLAAGCAGPGVQPLPTMFQPVPIDAAAYVPKVDSFAILLDDSASMGDSFGDRRKIDIARQLVFTMNRTIPALEYSAALQSFGQGECLPDEITSTLYGWGRYAESGLEEALSRVVCTGGNTPMTEGLNALAGDFRKMGGPAALILVSDGKVMHDSQPTAVVRKLKEEMGDRLCVYPILVGDDSGGFSLMNEIARIGGCGEFYAGGDLLSSGAMGAFVKSALLAEAPPAPAPEPPPPAPAPPVTQKDSDFDGVPDSMDRCPDTPAGVEVNVAGCWVYKDLNFAFDSAEIRPKYFPLLDEVVQVMERNPKLEIEIHGHTDNVGPESYNQKLSERRAESVKAYLVSQGIDPARLTTKGMGEADPMATNSTEAGREENRRVEFNIVNR